MDDKPTIGIVEYRDEFAQAFHDINAEWISAMYSLEPEDLAMLRDPRGMILDKGGMILLAELSAAGPGAGPVAGPVSGPVSRIVGTCALKSRGNGAYELTKMGVLAEARGRKIGETLLVAAIARAHFIDDLSTLFLLTNTRSAAAIHLYEKLGFLHDQEIKARYGATYTRCNVAMRFAGTA